MNPFSDGPLNDLTPCRFLVGNFEEWENLRVYFQNTRSQNSKFLLLRLHRRHLNRQAVTDLCIQQV